MVNTQPYATIRRLGGGVEVRDYPRHTLISHRVQGQFDGAANRGFGPLVRYISGANQRSEHIAMTTPVLHEPHRSGGHTISFVLPEGITAADAPVPGDVAVVVQQVPRRMVAALRFSGGLHETRAGAKEAQLLREVLAGGLVTIGAVFFAVYDPPWKPGFARRNDALVVIEETLT